MTGSGVDVDNVTFEVGRDKFCPEIPHIICVCHFPLNITECGLHVLPGVLHSMFPIPVNPQFTPTRRHMLLSQLILPLWVINTGTWQKYFGDRQKDISVVTLSITITSLYICGSALAIVTWLFSILHLNSLLVFLAVLQRNFSQCSGLILALWSLITLSYTKRLWLTLTSVNKIILFGIKTDACTYNGCYTVNWNIWCPFTSFLDLCQSICNQENEE